MTGVELGRYRRLVQYFWDPEPVNNKSAHTSIWCLGREYKTSGGSLLLSGQSNSSPTDSTPASIELSQSAIPSHSISSSVDTESVCYDSGNKEIASWPQGFLDDFETKVSLTYRSGFPPIPRFPNLKNPSSLSISVRLRNQLIEGTSYTSDTGWGCMIRSGQSLLANALVLLQLGRDWRRGMTVSEEKRIISLFADDLRAPFSLHRFVEHGAMACGKHPGEWFGPSATARCIQALTDRHESSNLQVYLTGDGPEVYEEVFLSTARSEDGNFKPTLILVGTRLGLEQITPVYWQALKACLQMPQSVGIAGGHPSSSHYFVGVQNSHFFYLDPHQTQSALPFRENFDEYTREEIDSCHTRRLRRIHIKEMDPSMLIAFLIRDETDWKDWCEKIEMVHDRSIIRVMEMNHCRCGEDIERIEAINEVETLDDDDD